ncbi:MAG: DUF2924 domain-containing protein, partial [Wolbachia sp.]
MENKEKEVASLVEKPLEELKKIWQEVFEKEAPRTTKKYLIPRIAYRMQEKA